MDTQFKLDLSSFNSLFNVVQLHYIIQWFLLLSYFYTGYLLYANAYRSCHWFISVCSRKMCGIFMESLSTLGKSSTVVYYDFVILFCRYQTISKVSTWAAASPEKHHESYNFSIAIKCICYTRVCKFIYTEDITLGLFCRLSKIICKLSGTCKDILCFLVSLEEFWRIELMLLFCKNEEAC